MEQKIRDTLMGSHGNKTYQKNYLIEAGAGAGKTFTLVHRIAHQLISGLCQPENMAVITFTNKSTEEMRKELNDLLQKQRDAASDPAEKQRLDELLRAAGRMQVSTIHSFCKTMLESMPFESGLGMETTYLEDENSACRDFFTRSYRKDPASFQCIEALGISYWQLSASFADLCDIIDGTITYVPESSAKIQSLKGNLVALMTKLHKDLSPKLQSCTEAWTLLDEKARELFSLSEQDFASDDENSFRLAALVALRDHPLNRYNSKSFLLSIRPRAGTANDAVKAQWKSIQKDWENAQGKAGAAAKELIHSRCMPIMLQLRDEYKQEKRAQHIISSNDLLLFTRDMLRDSSDARKALHDRFRVVYVDEFQDTDPIQAQILFYLTTDEKSFNKDWTQCRPVPGRLFLVGDPKQAIYRFRGADIDVYKDVANLFNKNGIGEIVHLGLNFRSAKQICDLVADTFKPDGSATVPGETDEVSQTLDGGYYQSSYADMTSKKGVIPLARTLYYEPMQGSHLNKAPNAEEKKLNDAHRIAAFIKKMCEDKVPVGSDGHTADYGDFLILPPRKEDVCLYAQELIAAGIPVNATGKQTLNEIDPIRRLLIHLGSLTAPGNNLELGKVLVLCYDIKLPTIRRFMQQAQITSLTSALYKEKIEALGTAFYAASNRDEEILSLCAVLKELSELRTMVRTEPAMTVIEKLLDGGYGIWAPCTGKEQRNREYAYVQQFLQLLRHSPEHEFSTLAAYAVECGNRFIEHELALEDNTNAVRIMNVHKSKGLQGEIVILPYAGGSKKPSVTHHTKRTGTGILHECCLYTPNGRHISVCGQPLLWENAPQGSIYSADREIKYLEAERVRLLYVAATRAATMLLVCDDTLAKESYWSTIAQHCDALTVTDPVYGAQFKCLNSRFDLPASSSPDDGNTATKKPPTPVDTNAIEQDLAELAKTRLSCKQYPITPSKLDSASRTAVTRKDKEDDTPPSDTLSDPADTDNIVLPAGKVFAPHGPHWGTIIHRILELAVRSKRFDTGSIEAFARQAVTETLSDEFLSETQIKMLFEHIEDYAGDWVDKLSRAAAQASAFLTQPDAPLRKLLEGAACYPELPFILRETDQNSHLYRHLSDHIENTDADGMELDVQGVIDLAVWKNGEWIVVDYKTDRIRTNDTADAFIARLRREYTAQIASYAQVLERLGKGKVTCAYLCSIPLSGELIRLDLNSGDSHGQATDTSAPQATPPQAIQTPATTPAASSFITCAANKLYANKHFNHVLSTTSGAFDFTLLLDGKPVELSDKHGASVTEFHKCRPFVAAVQDWLNKRCQNRNCFIDFANAGNQVLLRRMLKTMHQVLPEEDWNKIELKWNKPND